MFARHVVPWATALRPPLMAAPVRDGHAHHGVSLCDGVRRLFNFASHYVIYHIFFQLIFTLCSFEFVAFAIVCAYAVAAFLAGAFLLAFLGAEVPRRGLLAHRVRMRFHDPVLEELLLSTIEWRTR